MTNESSTNQSRSHPEVLALDRWRKGSELDRLLQRSTLKAPSFQMAQATQWGKKLGMSNRSHWGKMKVSTNINRP
jgi:hypothetical protein